MIVATINAALYAVARKRMSHDKKPCVCAIAVTTDVFGDTIFINLIAFDLQVRLGLLKFIQNDKLSLVGHVLDKPYVKRNVKNIQTSLNFEVTELLQYRASSNHKR